MSKEMDRFQGDLLRFSA